MLRKYGELINIEKISADNWKEQVTPASIRKEPDKQSKVAFEIDGDNFIYVRARAVSAGEKWDANGNGDYFPEEELVKSYRTFVGRGMYLNHDSDYVENSVGIILDAVWHPKEKFVECLCAIDKIHNIDLAEKIENGIVDSVSMGAMVDECECSVCGKKATSESEYCDHLRYYMGKEFNSKKVYAINRGVNFYELSFVTVPAEQEAKVLQVIAEQKREQSPARLKILQQHFWKYQSAKNAQGGEGVMSDGKIDKKADEKNPDTEQKTKKKDDLEELVEKTVEKVLDKVVEKEVIEKTRKQIQKDKIEEQIQEAIPISDIKEEISEKIEEIVPGATEAPKPVVEAPKIEEPPKEEKEVVDEEKEKTGRLRDRISRLLKGAFGEELKLEDEIPVPVEVPKMEKVELGDGFGVVDAGKQEDLVELIDREKATGLYTKKAPKDASAVEMVAYYRDKFGLEKKLEEQPLEDKQNLVEEEKAVKSGITFKYVPGATLEESRFIATKGNLVLEIKASDVLPKEVQENIMKKEATEVSSTEVGTASTTLKEYDVTKGETDTEHKTGDEPAQPADVVKKEAPKAEKADLSEGQKTDEVLPEHSKESPQPEDLIKKFAEDSDGSMLKLSKIWNAKIRVKKEAKIAGTGNVAREEAKSDAGNPREDAKAKKAHEEMDLPGKPGGDKGKEMKSFWDKMDSKSLPEGTEGERALKIAAQEIEGLKTKVADLEKKLGDKEKEATQEKKAALVRMILAKMEETGAIKADEREVERLKIDEGLKEEDACSQSYSSVKKAEMERLAGLDIPALESIYSVVSKYQVKDRIVESSQELESIEIPSVHTEEPESDEKKLSSIWGK